MESQTTLDKVRSLFTAPDTEPAYEPVESNIDSEDEDVERPVYYLPEAHEEPFSWLEYSIFLLLGIAMLWAWWVVSLCLLMVCS